MSARLGRPQASHKPRQHCDWSWQEHANCIDEDPHLFERPELYHLALQICAGCPVKNPCRQLGRGHTGVWGNRINDARKNRGIR